MGQRSILYIVALMLALIFLPLEAEDGEKSGYRGIEPYTHPGIVSYKGGRWVGNDHLYGLSPDISVVVETVFPSDYSGGLNGDLIRSQVETMIRKAGLNPFSDTAGVDKVLPFLHVLLRMQKVGDQVVTAIDVRLFEAVNLSRVNIEGSVVWQGLTWEKLEMVVGDDETISKTVENSVSDFVKRYLFYKKLKSYLQEQK